MKNLWAPWRMSYILGEDEQMAEDGCIFCLKDGDIPPIDKRLILYASEFSLVMMNRYPYTNGHLLVAPLAHQPGLNDLSKDELTDLISLTSRTVEIMKKEFDPAGFNVGLNLGKVAGAGVAEHLHFHIVPRWEGDHNFMTVLADVRVIPEHIEATYKRLKEAFEKEEQ